MNGSKLALGNFEAMGLPFPKVRRHTVNEIRIELPSDENQFLEADLNPSTGALSVFLHVSPGSPLERPEYFALVAQAFAQDVRSVRVFVDSRNERGLVAAVREALSAAGYRPIRGFRYHHLSEKERAAVTTVIAQSRLAQFARSIGMETLHLEKMLFREDGTVASVTARFSGRNRRVHETATVFRAYDYDMPEKHFFEGAMDRRGTVQLRMGNRMATDSQAGSIRNQIEFDRVYAKFSSRARRYQTLWEDPKEIAAINARILQLAGKDSVSIAETKELLPMVIRESWLAKQFRRHANTQLFIDWNAVEFDPASGLLLRAGAYWPVERSR